MGFKSIKKNFHWTTIGTSRTSIIIAHRACLVPWHSDKWVGILPGPRFKSVSTSELGTRQYCCDNETMFSGLKVVCYCKYYYIWCCYFILTPRPNYISSFFWSLRLYYVVALSLSRSYKIVACPALVNIIELSGDAENPKWDVDIWQIGIDRLHCP